MQLNLQAKAALVTGGSRGVGRAVAMGLAAEGARVAICGRDERTLEQTRDEIIAATRAEVICVKANVTRLNDLRRFISTAFKKFGRIDILVNNAGVPAVGTLEEFTDEQWEEQFELRLLAAIRACREVVPLMRQNPGGTAGGRIVNVAGFGNPNPRLFAAQVMSGALVTATKVLAAALDRDRIAVNAVCSGTIDTDFTTNLISALAVKLQQSPEEVRAAIQHATPGGRFLAADEVARVVLFLASETSSPLNGAAIAAGSGNPALA